jgi:hypothetical protein
MEFYFLLKFCLQLLPVSTLQIIKTICNCLSALQACEEMNGQEMQNRAVRLDFAQERNAYTPRSG